MERCGKQGQARTSSEKKHEVREAWRSFEKVRDRSSGSWELENHESEVAGLSSRVEASQESKENAENQKKKNDNDNIIAVIVMTTILW